MADLPARLAAEVETRSTPGAGAEDQERRRARAACALIGLGAGGAGWGLLRFAPDPQARSFLIHELGAAGIATHRSAAP